MKDEKKKKKKEKKDKKDKKDKKKAKKKAKKLKDNQIAAEAQNEGSSSGSYEGSDSEEDKRL